MTVPFSSRPLLPALPDIWTYSEEFKNLCNPPEPVTFFIELKITVLVGMLIPIANVSVANRTLIRPSEKSSSTIYLAKGSRSPWWTAYPFTQISCKNLNWSIYWSSGFKFERALDIFLMIFDFSALVVRSYV